MVVGGGFDPGSFRSKTVHQCSNSLQCSSNVVVQVILKYFIIPPLVACPVKDSNMQISSKLWFTLNSPLSHFYCFQNPDTEKPEINCPPNKDILKKNDIPVVTVYWDAPTYSDNSGLPVVIFTEAINGSQFSVGQHQITYTATDQANNVKSCHFFIVVSRK